MDVNSKKLIGIITDSAVDLSDELINKNDIKVLPYYVNISGKQYRSGIDITVNELFEYSDKYKEIPKTAQITPVNFIDYFSNFLNEYEKLIYIGLGSGFSGTNNNAFLAVRELEDNGLPKETIFVIDSCNLSSGIGLLILKACKLRDQGKQITKIAQEIQRCVPLVRTQFAINTLTYLHMGGRCSGTARLFGTLLKIKPIIKVVNGEMIVAKKPIGKYIKALDVILDYVHDDKDNIDPDNVMITHCLADDDAVYLRNELNKFLVCDNLYETYAGATVSTHCGPRCIGILYILKN